MVSVIIIYSKKLKINPDNVATPLAGTFNYIICIINKNKNINMIFINILFYNTIIIFIYINYLIWINS